MRVTRKYKKHDLLLTYEMQLRVAENIRKKKMQPAGFAAISHLVRRTFQRP